MGAAAAVIMMRERRLVEAFTLAAATSPDRALPVETLGVDYDALALRRLQQRAVIREGAPGRFYLDVPSWQALRRSGPTPSIFRRVAGGRWVLARDANLLTVDGAR